MFYLHVSVWNFLFHKNIMHFIWYSDPVCGGDISCNKSWNWNLIIILFVNLSAFSLTNLSVPFIT